MEKRQSSHIGLLGVFLLAMVFASFLAVSNKQAILDWYRLRSYTAPPVVAALADHTTMTSYGRNLFYVNHPELLTGAEFREKCPIGTEKTIVLGCYYGNDRGIFLYEVKDPRLDGVVQTTAAHEMLHAGYERLGSKEKADLNAKLDDYFRTVTDQHIKDTVEAYRQSEPNDLHNEMHSIFATEIATLPPELESYYDRYFTNRREVTELAAGYRQEFVSRREQAASYDQQLQEMKRTIDSNQEQVSRSQEQLESQLFEMRSLRQSNPDAYNQRVSVYNQQVEEYNRLLSRTRALIEDYNALVERRNALALEEQELVKALSGREANTE